MNKNKQVSSQCREIMINERQQNEKQNSISIIVNYCKIL